MIYNRGSLLTISDVSIFKRNRSAEKRTANYVCQIRNPETGKFAGGKIISINVLAKKIGYTHDNINKSDAKYIVECAIKQGILKYDAVANDDERSNLIEYVEKICTFESSPWVTYKATKIKKPVTKRYVDNMLRSFQIHAKPFISHKKTLASFTLADARKLIDKMDSKNTSPDNINMAIKAIRTAYNFAILNGLIENNPVALIDPVNPDRKEKVILLRSEAVKVLEVMKSHAVETLTRRIAYLGVKLAIYCGMREGEIRTISVSRISPVYDNDGSSTNYYKVEIKTGWDESSKIIKTTKGRYSRTTVIHKDLADEIFEFAKDTGRLGDSLLFCSETDSNKPVVKNVYQRYLYEALDEIGIDEEQRKERGITFHSLRHFYDSEAKSTATNTDKIFKDIQDAIGHKSKNVEQIYTHDTPLKLISLGVISEHILDL